MGTKKSLPKKGEKTILTKKSAKQGSQLGRDSKVSDWLPDPRTILENPRSTFSQRTAAQRVLELKPGDDFNLMAILQGVQKRTVHVKGHFEIDKRWDDEIGIYYVIFQKRADGAILKLGSVGLFASNACIAKVHDDRLNCGVPINNFAGAFLTNAESFGEAVFHIVRNFALEENCASDCTPSSQSGGTTGSKDGPLLEAVEAVRAGKYVVAMTGAGISAESGIPTFRAADDAIWNTVDARKFDIEYFRKYPKGFWRNLQPFRSSFKNVQPNTGHRALAEMEALGKLRMVITQNVDGLHQAAGSKKVLEAHGNLRNVVCLSCNLRFPVEGRSWGKLPECPECGAVLKPDAVLFGETLPMKVFNKGLKAFQSCDVLLLVGTSGEIPPMNQAPQWAKDNGAKIIEVNPEPTLFTESVTDIFLEGKAGPILFALAQGLHETKLTKKNRGKQVDA